MRFLSWLVIGSLFYSCSFNRKQDSSILLDQVDLEKAKTFLPGFHGSNMPTLEERYASAEDFSVHSAMISHNRFVFLDFAEDLHTDNLRDITHEFDSISQSVTIYSAKNTVDEIRYHKFLGRTLQVFNSDRSSHLCKINSIVYVNDMAYNDKPYLALVIENPVGVVLDHPWASSRKTWNPFRYLEIPAEEFKVQALAEFDSLAEFRHANELFNQDQDLYADEIYVRVFEFLKNEKYIFISKSWYGDCDVMSENYSALFHVTPTGWVCETEGSLTMSFHDLMDLDGDGFPEFIFHDMGSTAIYERACPGFKTKRFLNWSGAFCPC